MSTKSPECWSSDPNARAVKIELSAEQSLLLSFDQFAFAELKSEGKEQRLSLVFATHEVTLRGHALRRIETAMQRMELSLLVALPSTGNASGIYLPSRRTEGGVIVLNPQLVKLQIISTGDSPPSL